MSDHWIQNELKEVNLEDKRLNDRFAEVLQALIMSVFQRHDTRTHEERLLRKKKHSSIPIEEKESVRWLEGFRATRELAERNPHTKCICIGDSESDILKFLSNQEVPIPTY